MLGSNNERIQPLVNHHSRGTMNSSLPTVRMVAMLALIAGCSAWSTMPDHQDGSAEVQGSMFHTDSGTYHFAVTSTEKRVTITTRFTNTSGSPVYIIPCGTSVLLRLEKRVADSWQLAYQPTCTAEARAPIEVGPGATYHDTANLVEVLAANGAPKFTVSSLVGTYRAVYGGFKSWNPNPAGGPPGELLPEEARTSNEFTIEQ